MSTSTSPSQSGNGRGEIEAAKQRLLVAKKWVASAKKQLLTAKMEEQAAEKFLKTIEDKHEVTYVDSGDEKDEDDDNTKTKGNTALQEGEDEVGRKRQRSTLPPHASSVETSTLFAEEINHGRGDAHTLPMPEFGGVNPGILPRPELLTPVMMNHNPTGQTYHHQPNRASASIGLGLWSQRILASAIIFSNRHHHRHHHPFFLRNL